MGLSIGQLPTRQLASSNRASEKSQSDCGQDVSPYLIFGMTSITLAGFQSQGMNTRFIIENSEEQKIKKEIKC